jgi:hypothetical protein
MSLSVMPRGRTVAAHEGAADGNFKSGVAVCGTSVTDPHPPPGNGKV